MGRIAWLAGFGLFNILLCADLSIAEGPAGTMTHLGDEAGMHADAYGNTGPTMLPQGRVSPAGPHGETRLETMPPSGSSRPPNNLTPAPLLPLAPNRPLLPQASAPPSSPPPTGFGASSGRLGR